MVRPDDISLAVVEVFLQIAQGAVLRIDLDERKTVGKRCRIGQDVLDAVVADRLLRAFVAEARLDPGVNDRRHGARQTRDIEALDDRHVLRRKILAVLRIRGQPIPSPRLLSLRKGTARQKSKKKRENNGTP